MKTVAVRYLARGVNLIGVAISDAELGRLIDLAAGGPVRVRKIFVDVSLSRPAIRDACAAHLANNVSMSGT